jgi:hypothetical protein
MRGLTADKMKFIRPDVVRNFAKFVRSQLRNKGGSICLPVNVEGYQALLGASHIAPTGQLVLYNAAVFQTYPPEIRHLIRLILFIAHRLNFKDNPDRMPVEMWLYIVSMVVRQELGAEKLNLLIKMINGVAPVMRDGSPLALLDTGAPAPDV